MREDKEVDAGRPSSRAKDGDPLWVSTEVADVLVEPTQRLDLVQQPIVSLSRLITGTEEAWVFVATKGAENKERRDKITLVSVPLLFSTRLANAPHFDL